MSETVWYPSVQDVVAIHDSILAEYPQTERGVRDLGSVEFTLEYIEQGHFDDLPNSIHGKAVHLLRLLVANHPFVDGNKRTALNCVNVFYSLNGYRLGYDAVIKDILKECGSNAIDVDTRDVFEYLRSHTERFVLEEMVDEWREDLLQHGIENLSETVSDPND